MRELNPHIKMMELEHHLYTYNALVVGVYDGDSMTIIIDFGRNLKMKEKVRLLHVDTPELRGEEREEGLKVRDIVRSMILNRKVIIKTEKDKYGKYGRLLVEIFVDNINLNQWLLENGHAKKYPY